MYTWMCVCVCMCEYTVCYLHHSTYMRTDENSYVGHSSLSSYSFLWDFRYMLTLLAFKWILMIWSHVLMLGCQVLYLLQHFLVLLHSFNVYLTFIIFQYNIYFMIKLVSFSSNFVGKSCVPLNNWFLFSFSKQINEAALKTEQRPYKFY